MVNERTNPARPIGEVSKIRNLIDDEKLAFLEAGDSAVEMCFVNPCRICVMLE